MEKRPAAKRAGAMAAMLSFLFLSGCVSHLELNEKIMVQSIGVDYEDGLYSIIAEFYTGSSTSVQSDNLQTEQVTAKASGSSISHALKEAEFNMGKPLIFGECQSIVLGRGVLENDIMEAMKVFSLSFESYPQAAFVGTLGKAEDVINVKYKGETLNMSKIQSVMDNSYRIGLSPNSRLIDIMTDVSKTNSGCYIPLMTVEDTGTDLTEDGQELFIMGGIITKEGKIVGTCDNSQSAGVFMFCLDGETTSVTIEHENKSTLVILHNMKTKITPILQDGKLAVYVDFKADAEYNVNNVLKSTFNQADEIEAKINAAIVSRLMDTAQNVIMKYNADIIKLENIIKNKNYRLWTKIEDEYDLYLENAEFIITANTIINRYSISQNA